MIGFFLFLLFLYFFFQSILSLLFYLFLWQIKEYRFDRFFCHLKTRTGQKQMIDYLNLFKWKGCYRPVLTLKSFLVFLFSLFLFFRTWFFLLKHLPFSFSVRIFLVTALVNLLSPVLVGFSILIFKPISIFFKKIIILLAKKKIAGFPRLLVIGITGSFGKTTTKEILATLLAENFKVLKTPQNWNTEIGVAKTILKFLKKEDKIFVVEMGAYKRGEIKAICKLVHPQIGIITGINAQHSALFGGLSQIMKAKYELIKSLPKDGLAVFNGDNSYCRQLAQKTKIKKILYSLDKIKIIKEEKDKLRFKINNCSFRLNLLGKFQLSNFLAAFFVARRLGVSLAAIKKAALKIEPFKGTMCPFVGLNGGFFIDDSYNSNPDGFLAALSYLEKRRGRKIVVTSGIIELGKATSKIHRQIGQKLSSVADLVIVSKEEQAELIKKGGTRVLTIEDPKKLILFLKKEIERGDIILLEGRLPQGVLRSLK